MNRRVVHIAPLILAGSYWIWTRLYLLPQVQTESGEIGGSGQAFLSVAAFPVGLVLGVTVHCIYCALKGRLKGIAVLLPFLISLILACSVGSAIGVVSGQYELTETLTSVIGGLLEHFLVPCVCMGLYY